MKKISIVIPTYNEIENIELLTKEVIKEIENTLSNYEYEILIIDNDSEDGTTDVIKILCNDNKRIKAILNERNFGVDNSQYYGLLQSTGDCAILFCADFQDPIEMISKLVKEWESGNRVVVAVKTESRENSFIRFFRTLYYRLIHQVSDVEIIEHFTGFGCYDRKFIETLKEINDPVPFLRGVVAEFSGKHAIVSYEQQKRRAGKSHIKFFTLYDIAMRSFTSYTKVGLRIASFFGYIVAFISFVIALIYAIRKLLNWDAFEFGIPVILVGMFFLGAVQLIFLGFLGEYIIAINQRSMNRPLVVERERINFEEASNN